MISSSWCRRRLFVASLVVTGIPFLMGAQNPVAVESLSEPAESSLSAGSAGAAENGAGFESQYQLQVLQQEVLELRGLIEQLNHEIAEMKRLQENRYLDVDARLQAIGSQAGSQTGGLPDLPESGKRSSKNTQPANTKTEKGLYESALAKIRGREYDGAISDLQGLIERYPDGSFTANAYYWLGEIYAAKPVPDYEKARQSLAQVISFFPDHRKVPDAAFKLGKVYHLMGDCDRARELLENIVEKHQGKSVARLAETYLRDKLNCE